MQLRLRRAVEIARSEGMLVLLKKFARHGSELVRAQLSSARFEQQRNYRLAVDEMHAKATKMRAMPRDVTITTTTFCNLKCVMCEHVVDNMPDSEMRDRFLVRRHHLDERLVERLKPLLPTADAFQLHGLGEPLMAPAFWKLLDEISSLHHGEPRISINSNGLLLNEKTIDRIMRSKLNEISISLDAATAETYAKIRGADFSKVLANVAALVRARRKAGRDDLIVMLNMTLMRANIEELPDFVRLAKRLAADTVAFWRLNDGENYQRPEWVVDKDDWRFTYRDEGPKLYPNLFNSKIREAMRVGEQIGMRIQEDVIKGHLIEGEGQREDARYEPTVYTLAESLIDVNGGLSVIESSANGCATMCAPPPAVDVVEHGSNVHRLDAASDEPAPKSATIGECEAPWRWLVVSERGDCLPCCHAQEYVGNLNDSSVDEIWNGQTMQELRSSITKGEVHRVCQGASCKYVRGDVA